MSITATHLRLAEIGLRRGVDIVETMPGTRRKESDGTALLRCGFRVCVCVCVCVCVLKRQKVVPVLREMNPEFESTCSITMLKELTVKPS